MAYLNQGTHNLATFGCDMIPPRFWNLFDEAVLTKLFEYPAHLGALLATILDVGKDCFPDIFVAEAAYKESPVTDCFHDAYDFSRPYIKTGHPFTVDFLP